MYKVNKGCSSIPAVHMLWGKTRKCSLLRTELKGLMHHTADFLLKPCGSWLDPCHLSSFLPPCWSPRLELWRCRRGGGRGREPVSLLPRKPRLAYLTPVLMTSQTGIVHSQLGILLKGRDLAAEMKVCCSSTHKESLFIVVLPLGGKTVTFWVSLYK